MSDVNRIKLVLVEKKRTNKSSENSLLTKLDVIREQLGDDRVYDVIQDVLKGVALDSIIESVLNGHESDLDLFIDKPATELGSLFKKSIDEQSKSMAHTEVDFREARLLKEDSDERRLQYLQEAFSQVIFDLQGEISQLQSHIFINEDERTQQKLMAKEARLRELKQRKQQRLQEFQQMTTLSATQPDVLGCAYVVPLSQMESHRNFGMSRDDEVEQTVMQVAMEYEQSQGRRVDDVSKDNVGYDLRSIDAQGQKRYIEVKGRARTDGVMLSENEMNRLAQLGGKAK